jgi:hypothetical protein
MKQRGGKAEGYRSSCLARGCGKGCATTRVGVGSGLSNRLLTGAGALPLAAAEEDEAEAAEAEAEVEAEAEAEAEVVVGSAMGTTRWLKKWKVEYVRRTSLSISSRISWSLKN